MAVAGTTPVTGAMPVTGATTRVTGGTGTEACKEGAKLAVLC